jgi:hypothetical protein
MQLVDFDRRGVGEIRNLSAAAAPMHANPRPVPDLNQNEDFDTLGNLLKALAKIASAELRPGEAAVTSVDLHAVREQLRLVVDPRFRDSDISVQWDVAPDLPRVWAEEPRASPEPGAKQAQGAEHFGSQTVHDLGGRGT